MAASTILTGTLSPRRKCHYTTLGKMPTFLARWWACCPNGRAGFRACRLRSFPTSRTKADSLTGNPGTGRSPEPADRNVCPASEAENDFGQHAREMRRVKNHRPHAKSFKSILVGPQRVAQLAAPGGTQRGEGALVNFLRRALGLDGQQQAALLVEVGQRFGAFFINLHAHADGFGPVVFALLEFCPAMITNAFHARRERGHVEDRLAIRAGAPAAQARDNFFDGQIVIQHGVERDLLLLHDFGESLRLRDRARKSVEQEPAAAADATSALADEIEHGLVGDQVAAPHVAERGSQRRAALALGEAFGGAENVAGGKVAGAQPFAEQFGLGSLAHARRPEEHQTKKTRWQRRENFALGRAALDPGYSNFLCAHIISMENLYPARTTCCEGGTNSRHI